MATEVKLPELGENVEKGDVLRVLVKAGDTIAEDQPIIELETDKATIEVPSSAAGKVAEVRVKAGDKVNVGQVVLVVEAAEGAAAAAPAQPDAPAQPAAASQAAPAASDRAPQADRQPPPSDQKAQQEATKATDAAAPPDTRPAQKPASVVEFASARPAPRPEPTRAESAASTAAGSAPAAPSVRRFARELGVDIGAVSGSGPGGRINQEDVKAHVKGTMSSGGALRLPGAGPLPDFARWGEIEVKPMSGIRRKTAEQLSIAWQAPHVTQHDKADVTTLEAFRARYGPRVEKAGGKLTVTAILIKICALAIDRFPQFASSVDMANEAIVFKKYRHVGVAVDTPAGLLVPVIRDADRKSLTEIAVELGALSQKARDRKLGLDEMSGGVFSISNLGGIGGTSFTPIINQPEVAILGVSRGIKEPVWDGQAFLPRDLLPLSLSYDHRVIDGADAARFLRFVAEALESPISLYL
jgi:pyruvate dehydrogenase E2 component (dihydrolipoamide acetyltransferase)